MSGMEEALEHSASAAQMRAREDLATLFVGSPMSEQDTLFNLGMYVRSGVLAKFLVMADLYRRFLPVPGIMCEFGVWMGQNAILLENLRAIYEPFHKRPYVGFDTWVGYPDRPDWYRAGEHGKRHLERLLDCHARMNVYGHLPSGHELVQGNVCETAPDYFAEHRETIVAFAYFDMGPYDATLAALKAIKPRLVRGSVLLMDELTWSGAPGEAIAFRETFDRGEYDLEKCALYPSKSIVTIR